MIKQLGLGILALGLAVNTYALNKNLVDLDSNFWGSWSVYNSKNKCTETYQFLKPGKLNYIGKQKKMTGEFAVLRSKEDNLLDVLAIKIETDNQKPGCGVEKVNYTNSDIRLSLKWISPKTAELCTDAEGKQCSGLYLIKN